MKTGMQLQGKIALITGGTSGIGLATAHCLVGAGAAVTITVRDGERPRRAQDGLGPDADAIAADITDFRDIDRLMAKVRERRGRLDILVINAGVANGPSVQKLDADSYAALMDVNCRGATLSFAHAMPLLADGAAVIFVGSVAGRKGQPGDALYAGSKGFIRAFARNLGTDPGILSRGIWVNVVTPGPIDTPLTAEAVSNPAADAFVKALVPMKRWGQADEVANGILFLASSQSSFTTGAEITVDGGMAHVWSARSSSSFKETKEMQILERAFRVYTDPEAFEKTIAFYEGLQGCACERRIAIEETGVAAAKVGGFLILGGSDEQLTAARQVSALFYVDDLDAFAGWLWENGVAILHGPQTVTGGRNLTARHPDGQVAEYFEAQS